jgi:hypothetical protein
LFQERTLPFLYHFFTDLLVFTAPHVACGRDLAAFVGNCRGFQRCARPTSELGDPDFTGFYRFFTDFWFSAAQATFDRTKSHQTAPNRTKPHQKPPILAGRGQQGVQASPSLPDQMPAPPCDFTVSLPFLYRDPVFRVVYPGLRFMDHGWWGALPSTLQPSKLVEALRA